MKCSGSRFYYCTLSACLTAGCSHISKNTYQNRHAQFDLMMSNAMTLSNLLNIRVSSIYEFQAKYSFFIFPTKPPKIKQYGKSTKFFEFLLSSKNTSLGAEVAEVLFVIILTTFDFLSSL